MSSARMGHRTAAGSAWIRATVAPAVFAVLWSLVAPVYGLPSLWAVGRATVEMIRAGTFVHDILVSSFRGLTGFVVGFCLGIATGVVTGHFMKAYMALGGLLLFLRWTPVLALVPLTLRIGGLGEGPKVFLVTWACFFITWAYAHVAVSKLNPNYRWWADSLGISGRDRIAYIYTPAVAPSLIGGARVGLAVALIVVVAAELGGTLQSGPFRGGLGFRISRAIETGRNDVNVACILTFGVIGIAYDWLMMQFVRRVLTPLTRIDFLRTRE